MLSGVLILVTITTELPHNLTVGSQVEILNIRSTNNTIGANDLGFNGIFTVTAIQNTKQFSYTLTTPILEHLQVIQQIEPHHYLIIEERDLTILISSIDLKKHRDILQENKMGFIT
jgi:hypothetical protein